ncbi:MAG: hypothetical protein ACPG8W_08900 [Candidatus Promineifilaceae bacterium]
MDNVQFEKAILAGWRNFKTLYHLGALPLGVSPACQAIAFGMRDVAADRGYSVRAMLQASLRMLSAELADTLSKRYIEGKSAEAIAQQYILERRTIERRIQKAVKTTSKWLVTALQSEATGKEQWDLAVAVRYADLSDAEKQTARYLALFQKPEQITFMANTATLEVLPHIPAIDRIGLLLTIEGRIDVIPQAKAWLVQQSSIEEGRRWQTSIAQLYKNNTLQAAFHWQQAGSMLHSLNILWKQRLLLTKDVPFQQWQTRLQAIDEQSLASVARSKYHILHGHILQRCDELQRALNSYELAEGEAIRAGSLELQLEAMYLQAHAHQDSQPEFAEIILNRMLELSEGMHSVWMTAGFSLLAWLCFEQRCEFERGLAFLKQANSIAEDAQFSARTQSEYHNTWTEYYRRNETAQDNEKYLHHSRLAYRHGLESTNSFWRVQMHYNLAVARLHCRQPDMLNVIQQNYERCLDAGAEELAAKNRNILASYYANVTKTFDLAAECYKEAYQCNKRLGNRRSIASDCLGTLFALMSLGNVREARAYFDEGKQIATELKHQGLLKEFIWHETCYPELLEQLPPEQDTAIQHVHLNGSINNKTYRALTGVSSKTASKHLTALANLGIFKREGKTGSKVRYVLQNTNGCD